MKPRRGFSLAELLVMMTISSVVLTMSVALIHRIMHTESQSRRFYNVERNAIRLSDQFRHDVHEAEGAVVSGETQDNGVFLQLRLADGQSLDYGRRGGIVSRTKKDGDKTVNRDEFAFPDNIELTIRQSWSPRRLVLSITADPPPAAESKGQPVWNQYSTKVSFQVEANLGRDLRFAASKAAN